jgi:hypothetical protein
VDVDWSYVERIMPIKLIPEPPAHATYPTPSGWRPPRGVHASSKPYFMKSCADPPPSLPYVVRRNRYHAFPLFLETRRDQLNIDTMEFEYMPVVKLIPVEGDVFVSWLIYTDLCKFGCTGVRTRSTRLLRTPTRHGDRDKRERTTRQDQCEGCRTADH